MEPIDIALIIAGIALLITIFDKTRIIRTNISVNKDKN